LREAAVLLDRLLGGTLLPPELIEQMLNGHGINAHIPQQPWQEPAYGPGLMCGKVLQGACIASHTGGRPGSVIAVNRLYHRRFIRTGAAFLPGEDAGAVERAAVL